MTLADRLKKVRIDNNLTQVQFAEIMGVTLPRVRNIENQGTKSLSESEIINLKSRLSISIEWLFTGQGSMFTAKTEEPIIEFNKAETALITRFRALSHENQLDVMKYTDRIYRLEKLDATEQTAQQKKLA